MTQTPIREVKEFWNSNPCQSDLSQAQNRRKYFEEIAQRRYGRREWYVPEVARFANYRDKKVLEIGCSIATDGLEFAKQGADYTGIDLTPASIEIARERFELFDVPGQFEVVNAEDRLPFADASFDHVYSWGVIHHSPKPERIVSEIYRVLRPGGTFTVMLYNRSSINYYIEIMCLRKLLRYLLRPKFMPALLARVTGFDRWKLEGHRDALTKTLTHDEWVSMNTDGPFCPLARVYNRREAALLFGAFQNVKQELWEFNVDHWPYVRRLIPVSVEKWLGRRWGWSRVISGRKVETAKPEDASAS
jgi:ubiquinone/menaquinone biosynthesis C-methylase UbiE